MSSQPPPIPLDDAVRQVQTFWNNFSETYTDMANKRMTIQGSSALHAHMELDDATSILEIGAGAGVGTMDMLSRLSTERETRVLTTDLSPEMLQRLEARIAPFHGKAKVDVALANAQELQGLEDASFDRYIASLVLQLTPDPDAMLREAYRVLMPKGLAGFVIWGSPEHSGLFTIPSMMEKELDIGNRGAMHGNFALGLKLDELKAKMHKLGFSSVISWPFLCIAEKWSGERNAEYHNQMYPLSPDAFPDDAARLAAQRQRFETMTRLSNEWFATKGMPIGLEVYLIVARK
ncbi:hypothetical protein SPRG_07759 [Saprolegnia parasitica CBS 223.65]|uniref:Methyltransferase type 11 domain-containing protein n=1 Tax=Saprolegnia parasitica (strain CBS 223.65) TaxID=695850 RepID=A0A067C958_SAPPC|nr:hypothetical protein SPRG_07759 [Saprolegnia parasitica CBS 223.65]KDO27048.1 hypothetical protein SPRG_07759 [Saprolegnia parasitica CBS 223.65]|eukprot:XP_012202143.1 hypothetical protein SPRG_07759 [Saprolegnia parasitica CBS 223.65]